MPALQPSASADQTPRRPPLKLLFVNSSLTDGGSEKAMCLVAGALAAQGHDVTMALVREKQSTYPVDPRIRLVQLRYGGSGRIRKLWTRIRRIRRLLASGSFDYTVCFMWDLNVTTLLASVGLDARVIVSERAFPGSVTRSTFSRQIEKILYRLAYRIVYQTHDAQAFCPARLTARSTVVPNMIELPSHEGHRAARSRRIVSVGRLVPQKNFPLLLRAFADFLPLHSDWVLEIYGSGALETGLISLANELGIANSVVFAGYVDNIPARIQDAGMFVLASDFEGISNAMSEAMALGLPVICTDCPAGGAALLIEHGVSGLLVPVGNQDALVNAMHNVATDAALAERIAYGARQSVARFTPEHLVRVWETEVLI